MKTYAYVTVEPSYAWNGNVTGFKMTKIRQNKPADGRIIKVTMELPDKFFDPENIQVQVSVPETPDLPEPSATGEEMYLT